MVVIVFLNSMKNPKILLIEDDPDCAGIYRRYLEQAGYPKEQVMICTCYQEAGSVSEEGIDLVITDLGLPDVAPGQTFELVRQLFPDIPIIIITADRDKNAGIRAIEQGADDYLVKGNVDKDTLERSVRYAIVRHKSLRDYRRLFDDNPAPMYIIDPASLRFLAVNQAALAQYGYSMEEFLSLTADEIRPETEIPRLREAIAGVPMDYHDFGRWLHQHKNGTIFTTQIYAHTTLFEGRWARLIMPLNIEKQVEAEQALERKATETENILESITDAFFAVNNAHRLTYVNSTFEKILHKRRDEVLGQDLWDVFHELVHLPFKSEYDRAVKERQSVHFEAYYPPLDKWLLVNGYPSETGFAAFFIDITEQKRLHEAIYFNEKNLFALINNTPDLIWSVDRDLKIITANNNFYERMRKLTGKTVSQLEQAHFNELMYKEWQAYYRRAFAGENFTVVRQPKVEGKVRYEEVSFNPIWDDDKNVIGLSCFARDITQQQQHLLMIEEQNEKLRRINWFQSHELRKPVANILGLTALIDKSRLHEPDTLKILEYLQQSAKELDEVIRKIVDVGT